MRNPTYLGTSLDPASYYDVHADRYQNAHADAIETVLRRLAGGIEGPVLDLGCGAGLATEVLRKMKGPLDFIGIDASPAMADRYRIETGYPGVTAFFWDPLPKGRSAVIAHALHLCPESRKHEIEWRLQEAGVSTLIVVSPLKRAIEGLNATLTQETSAASKSGDGKTVWGWRFVLEPQRV